ncbi:DUF1697 domain-containing protein [Devosia sediminis]|uniref:DUF1697 domain-containing protein n=1 Tax=Devosia sediminis TaxID=2798801 RepID=A0A934J021_9HYPH|nr:DUF1697 domain-containing protein [Devosia sediminis]MBJ3785330.1 DUF1697 domain-containing protein [Devosia sediminis]
MADRAPTFIILLRAIGPVTHKLMSMAQWRDAAEQAGFSAPETMVNTGNMIAQFGGTAEAARKAMLPVLRGFGLGENIAPIVRKPAQLRALLGADPISDAAQARPSETGVYFFAAKTPDFDWIKDHDGPEAIHVVADHLVVDFTQDVAKSGKLIRKIDKFCGLNTARNWNTTRKLAERASAREKE